MFLIFYQLCNNFVVNFSPKINKDVTIEVESTVNMRFLTYQILGRGDIIITQTIQIDNQQSHTFSFLASFAMVPKAQVIVYTVKNDEIISDHIEIDFGNDLQNFLTIELSTDQASPGQEIDITVISKPNSYVGLLGVDQSVLLLRKGNDLEKIEVFDELEQYEKKNIMNRYNEDNWIDFNVSEFSFYRIKRYLFIVSVLFCHFRKPELYFWQMLEHQNEVSLLFSILHEKKTKKKCKTKRKKNKTIDSI